MGFGYYNRPVVSKLRALLSSVFSFYRRASADTAVLRVGDSGTKVEALQRSLRVLELYDYPDTDGYFGSDTRNALMNFQRENDIEMSGVADAETIYALDRALDDMYPQIDFKRPMHLKTVGRDVKNLQRILKSLGYFSSRPSGVFDEATYSAVCNFQGDYGMAVDGKVNRRLVIKLNDVSSKLRPFRIATEKKVEKSVENVTPVSEISLNDIYQTDAVKVQWHAVDEAWKVGEVISVKDIGTGISFNMKRTGGANHADAEPLTKKDTEALKNIFKDGWSWARRPVIMSIAYITTAASICGMPHGEFSVIGNGVQGHFCIHFYESLDDQTGCVDEAHQKAIDLASNYTVNRNEQI